MRLSIKVFLIAVFVFSIACDMTSWKHEKNGGGTGLVKEKPLDIRLLGTYARALAASDKRVEVEGKDYIAENFLPEYYRGIVKDPAKREKAIKQLPEPWYMYAMASTIYIDQVVKKALSDNIAQIVFLGTGYDSTPYRLKDLIKKTPVFEVGAHAILANKKKLLAKANIAIPSNVKYVPMYFTNDTWIDELVKEGYRKDKKTLFVLFHVVRFFPRELTIGVLDFIKSSSPAGSSVCFDYLTSYELLIMYQKFNFVVQEWFMREYYPDIKISIHFYKEIEMKSLLDKEGFEIIELIMGKNFDFEKRFPMLYSKHLNGGVAVECNFVHARVL